MDGKAFFSFNNQFSLEEMDTAESNLMNQMVGDTKTCTISPPTFEDSIEAGSHSLVVSSQSHAVFLNIEIMNSRK